MINFFSQKNNVIKYYLALTLVLATASASLYFFDLTKDEVYFLLVSMTGFIGLITPSFFIFKNTPFITVTEEALIINAVNSQQEDTLKLAYEEVKHFETRFNELVFCLHDDKKVSVKLDRIKSDKKRWEIKELLRQHFAENKTHREIIA